MIVIMYQMNTCLRNYRIIHKYTRGCLDKQNRLLVPVLTRWKEVRALWRSSGIWKWSRSGSDFWTRAR